MGTKSKTIRDKLREQMENSVRDGSITPRSVERFLIDNGWEYPMPTRPTIEKLLKFNGIEFIKGYWTKL